MPAPTVAWRVACPCLLPLLHGVCGACLLPLCCMAGGLPLLHGLGWGMAAWGRGSIFFISACAPAVLSDCAPSACWVLGRREGSHALDNDGCVCVRVCRLTSLAVAVGVGVAAALLPLLVPVAVALVEMWWSLWITALLALAAQAWVRWAPVVRA